MHKKQFLLLSASCIFSAGLLTACQQKPHNEVVNTTAETVISSEIDTSIEEIISTEAETSTEEILASEAETSTEEMTSSEAEISTESITSAEIATAEVTSDAVTETTEFETEAVPETVGTFDTSDIYDNPINETIFADHDLTMVNVFATWCAPCIDEIPGIAELAKEYEGSNFQIIGIILDARTEEKIETAKYLAEITGAEYPFVKADYYLHYGILADTYSIPETFFIDSTGTLVSERYVGSRTKDQWKEIIEKELADFENDKASSKN